MRYLRHSTEKGDFLCFLYGEFLWMKVNSILNKSHDDENNKEFAFMVKPQHKDQNSSHKCNTFRSKDNSTLDMGRERSMTPYCLSGELSFAQTKSHTPACFI